MYNSIIIERANLSPFEVNYVRRVFYYESIIVYRNLIGLHLDSFRELGRLEINTDIIYKLQLLSELVTALEQLSGAANNQIEGIPSDLFKSFP